MARQARGKSMDPAKVQVFHTVQRCLRRAFLCGEDTVSGKSYDHRKQWIRERLEFLASIFAIDLLTYTVLSNHLHLVMRSRPDVVAAWSNQEVVARYAIPDHLEPILQRIGIVSSGWCDLIQQFGRLFKRAVGSPQALANEAKARGQKYLHGTKTTAFATS